MCLLSRHIICVNLVDTLFVSIDLECALLTYEILSASNIFLEEILATVDIVCSFEA